MTPHITADIELLSVLRVGSEDDLAILSDYITDNNKGRVALDAAIRDQLDAAIRNKTLSVHHELIAKEIQEFGGNSVINFFRGLNGTARGIAYREIVRDVAKHMNVEFEDDDNVESIELNILIKIALDGLKNLNPDEQKEFILNASDGQVKGTGPVAIAALIALFKAGGFNSFKLALIVANAVSRKLIGKGLTLAANRALVKTLGSFVGPIGLAINAIWAGYDLSSPAYRVTVPCVVQIAYMRQKMLSQSGQKT